MTPSAALPCPNPLLAPLFWGGLGCFYLPALSHQSLPPCPLVSMARHVKCVRAPVAPPLPLASQHKPAVCCRTRRAPPGARSPSPSSRRPLPALIPECEIVSSSPHLVFPPSPSPPLSPRNRIHGSVRSVATLYGPLPPPPRRGACTPVSFDAPPYPGAPCLSLSESLLPRCILYCPPFTHPFTHICTPTLFPSALPMRLRYRLAVRALGQPTRRAVPLPLACVLWRSSEAASFPPLEPFCSVLLPNTHTLFAPLSRCLLAASNSLGLPLPASCPLPAASLPAVLTLRLQPWLLPSSHGLQPTTPNSF